MSIFDYILKLTLCLPKPNRRVSKFRFVRRAGQLPIFFMDPICDKNVKWNNVQTCAKTSTLLKVIFVGEAEGGGGGIICPDHPSPILHAPRDNISRKGNPSLRCLLCFLNLCIPARFYCPHPCRKCEFVLLFTASSSSFRQWP